MHKRIGIICWIVIISFLAGNVPIKASTSNLGNGLTPLGAEEAGNKDGTIPPWMGGITTPPDEYKKGDHHSDPYADDKKLFTINKANLDNHIDKLTPGQVALMKRYPSFEINVYPTRRSASLPQRIYDATIANKKSSKLIKDGNFVDGAIMGIPFPVPQNGQEAIWNHLLRYRGDAVFLMNNQAAITAHGNYTLLKSEEWWYFPYNAKGAKIGQKDLKIFYLEQLGKAPPSVAGLVYLVHDPFNQATDKRQAWSYLPGQRRVVRIPQFTHDLMVDVTEGLRTVDQHDMFNGAIDRYNWELVGKKELYVPYNCYKLHSDKLKYKDILHSGHINTDYIRYELHRMWVIDATLKEDTKHIYPRRTFYLDEDSWQILIVDIYDKDGQLWRVSEGYVINYYEVPLTWTTLQVHYDLYLGRYYVNGLDNEERMYDFSIKRNPDDYTPAAIRRKGKR
jgi:hypothetical protein